MIVELVHEKTDKWDKNRRGRSRPNYWKSGLWTQIFQNKIEKIYILFYLNKQFGDNWIDI